MQFNNRAILLAKNDRVDSSHPSVILKKNGASASGLTTGRMAPIISSNASVS
jgi:hypothetical protein